MFDPTHDLSIVAMDSRFAELDKRLAALLALAGALESERLVTNDIALEADHLLSPASTELLAVYFSDADDAKKYQIAVEEIHAGVAAVVAASIGTIVLLLNHMFAWFSIHGYGTDKSALAKAELTDTKLQAIIAAAQNMSHPPSQFSKYGLNAGYAALMQKKLESHAGAVHKFSQQQGFIADNVACGPYVTNVHALYDVLRKDPPAGVIKDYLESLEELWSHLYETEKKFVDFYHKKATQQADAVEAIDIAGKQIATAEDLVAYYEDSYATIAKRAIAIWEGVKEISRTVGEARAEMRNQTLPSQMQTHMDAITRGLLQSRHRFPSLLQYATETEKQLTVLNESKNLLKKQQDHVEFMTAAASGSSKHLPALGMSEKDSDALQVGAKLNTLFQQYYKEAGHIVADIGTAIGRIAIYNGEALTAANALSEMIHASAKACEELMAQDGVGDLAKSAEWKSYMHDELANLKKEG